MSSPQIVVIEPHDLGSELRWSTTTHLQGARADRRWFARHADALAHGAGQADEFELPLIDLGGSGGE